MNQQPKKKRRLLVDAGLIALVVLAVLFSVKGSGFENSAVLSVYQATETAVPTATPDPLSSFIKNREKTRAQELDALKTLLSSSQTPESLKKTAGESIVTLNERTEQELAIESALAGMQLRGAASVSEKLAYVCVETKLSDTQAALLFTLIGEVTGLPSQNIRIAD